MKKNSLVETPETSQDAFESLFPSKQVMSTEEIRKRSNSMNKTNNPNISINNALVAAESNFWPQTANALELNSEQHGPGEQRVSVGYKREISHR